MATYLHPGVYVEEIPSGSKPVEGVATSVAAFVGYTTKGPLGTPVRITKYDAYNDQFGGVRDTAKLPQGDPMGHSVLSFFQNGGTTAYIVRITRNWMADATRTTTGETKDAEKAIGFTDHPSAANTTQALKFTAVNEGAWANGLVAKLTQESPPTDPDLWDVEIGRKDDEGEFTATETFSDVSLDGTDPQFIEGVVNDVSDLVTVKLIPLAEVAIPPESVTLGTSTSGDLSGVSLNFVTLTDPQRELKLALDGQPAFSITIPATAFGDLDAVAAAIEAEVQSGSTADRRKKFTCVASGARLVLTSGTRKKDSAVVVTNIGIAPTLDLGTANGGAEQTGKEASDIALAATAVTPTEATLSLGVDGSAPATADYQSVFTAFLKYRDINIILVPGQFWNVDGSGNAVISAAIAHAEKMMSRMVVVDPPVDHELTTPKGVNDLKLPTSTYSVLYYPWVKVANPFYHPETNPGVPKALLVPPSGFAAGMWSKIDARRGVWKAPAGVETGLLGVAGLQYTVEDGEQDVLNPLGVNALRARPGFGSVIWGARTLSTKADPEWRYVPVRRTAIMIEQSIYGGIQWAVFEPNDHRLWSALRTNIDGFMNGLFRSGAFQGEKASDAYFVRCGKGDTMTQTDIDTGKVIIIVGFAPLKPTEFVILRIQQKVLEQ